MDQRGEEARRRGGVKGQSAWLPRMIHDRTQAYSKTLFCEHGFVTGLLTHTKMEIQATELFSSPFLQGLLETSTSWLFFFIKASNPSRQMFSCSSQMGRWIVKYRMDKWVDGKMTLGHVWTRMGRRIERATDRMGDRRVKRDRRLIFIPRVSNTDILSKLAASMKCAQSDLEH